MFNLFKKEEEEYNYFSTFEAISFQIVKVSDLLLGHLNKNSLEEALEKSQAIEQVANEQKNELLNYLYEDFLPPIERQDIIALTYSLDVVFKQTRDIMNHLDMYQIKEIQPEMIEIMQLIKENTHKVPQMMKDLEDFKHPQKIREAIETMRKINKLGSEIYHKGVKNLNIGEMNSFETMKYTRMYECLNRVLEAIEDLINNVVAMIIQNT